MRSTTKITDRFSPLRQAGIGLLRVEGNRLCFGQHSSFATGCTAFMVTGIILSVICAAILYFHEQWTAGAVLAVIGGAAILGAGRWALSTANRQIIIDVERKRVEIRAGKHRRLLKNLRMQDLHLVVGRVVLPEHLSTGGPPDPTQLILLMAPSPTDGGRFRETICGPIAGFDTTFAAFEVFRQLGAWKGIAVHSGVSRVDPFKHYLEVTDDAVTVVSPQEKRLI